MEYYGHDLGRLEGIVRIYRSEGKGIGDTVNLEAEPRQFGIPAFGAMCLDREDRRLGLLGAWFCSYFYGYYC